MRREPIEVPAPMEEEEASDVAPASKSPEDEIFPISGVLDHLTGLPGRPIAFKALQSALSVGRPRYSGICSIDRLRFMSNRYGVEAGQEAIRFYAAHLRQKMPPDTMLFRWTGASLLALYDLSGPIADARAVLDHVNSQKVKFNFESHQRSALLSLTASTLVVGLASNHDASTVASDFDSFVNTHSRKQPD
jgi:GGDEF domain-containing protein